MGNPLMDNSDFITTDLLMVNAPEGDPLAAALLVLCAVRRASSPLTRLAPGGAASALLWAGPDASEAAWFLLESGIPTWLYLPPGDLLSDPSSAAESLLVRGCFALDWPTARAAARSACVCVLGPGEARWQASALLLAIERTRISSVESILLPEVY